MRARYLIPLLLLYNIAACGQWADTTQPTTIHIQKVSENKTLPKLDTLRSAPVKKKGRDTGIIMIGKHTLDFSRTNKIPREELLQADGVSIRGNYIFRYKTSARGGMGLFKWRKNVARDTVTGPCNESIEGFRLRFARRMTRYQLKKVLRVDGKKTYLISTNANFTQAMLDVMEAVPRGETIILYKCMVKKKDGNEKKLRRIIIKVT